MSSARTLLWGGPALRDLEELRDHIARDGRPGGARRLAQRIRARVESLREHPHLGRRIPELPDEEYRELIEPPCRIVYLPQEDRILILRVWHQRRDPGRILDGL